MTMMRMPALALALTGLAGVSSVTWAGQGNDWNFSGGDRENTRSQPSENKLSVANVGGLEPKWVFTTAGDVSATPAVDGDTVYFPDWAGNLYAVDKRTGALKWKVSIPAITGVPFDKARATPAVSSHSRSPIN